MTPSEFLEKFSFIENHLLTLAVDFDKKQGFPALLNLLKNNHLVSSEVWRELADLWHIRNKIVGYAGAASLDGMAKKKLNFIIESLSK